MSVLVSHPTGNANVRALLSGLEEQRLLGLFATTLAVAKDSPSPSWLLAKWKDQWERRRYPVANERLSRRPWLEVARLAGLTRTKGQAAVDCVYEDLDAWAAQQLVQWKTKSGLTVVYGYEDGSAGLFTRAKDLGLPRVYELPIAYFEAAQKILQQGQG
jgi:type II secretory pathway component PulJ